MSNIYERNYHTAEVKIYEMIIYFGLLGETTINQFQEYTEEHTKNIGTHRGTSEHK